MIKINKECKEELSKLYHFEKSYITLNSRYVPYFVFDKFKHQTLQKYWKHLHMLLNFGTEVTLKPPSIRLDQVKTNTNDPHINLQQFIDLLSN